MNTNPKICLLILCLITVMTPHKSAAFPVNTRQWDWKSISSDHFDVIFPDFMEEQGRYISSALEFMYPWQLHSLNPARTRRYPVLLSPDSMSPNGFVMTGPRRSVFYSMPITDMPGDWFTDLAVHEGRHMLQLDALHNSTLRAASFFYGELASLLTLSMPYWWLEGDAVMAETVMTASGRGRDPGFTALFKALMLEEKQFHYNKILLGSDKDHLPDLYQFGYLMNAWIRSSYNPMAPGIMFREFSRTPLPAWGAHRGIKKATGKGAEALYREMASAYGEFWRSQSASLSVTPVQALTTPLKSPFTHHSHLSLLPDGALAAARSDHHRGSEIIMIREGKETALAKGQVNSSLGSGGPYLVWDELEFDPKFDRSRIRIVLYNMETGKKRTLFGASRYVSPALSRDGTRIVLVEWKSDTTASLVIASTDAGGIEKELPLPKGEIWSDLSFSTDGNTIMGIAHGVMGAAGNQGKRICRIDTRTGTIEILLDAGFENIRSPFEHGAGVYYVSNHSGIDTVYVLDHRGERFQVLIRPIGAYSPRVSLSGEELFFIDWAGSRGTVISSAPLSPDKWIPFADVTVIREDFFAPMEIDEPAAGLFIPKNIPLHTIPAEEYSMAFRGDRITAWGVLPGGDSGQGVQLFIHARHIARIRESALLFEYDHGYKSLGLEYQFRHRTAFPDFILRAGNDLRYLDADAVNEPWMSLGMELPFGGGSVGSLLWSAVPGISIGGKNSEGEVMVPLRGEAGFTLSSFRWNFEISALHEVDIMTPEWQDRSFYQSSLELPGIFRSHRLLASASYEQREEDDVAYSSFTRGYQDVGGNNTLSGSAGYSIPLLYPDLAIGPVLYLPLISLEPFYDYSRAFDTGEVRSSAGADLLFHVHPLQLPFRLDLGVRFTRILETETNLIEFVLMGMTF